MRNGDLGIVERLKRLQTELDEVYDETVDLRRAAEDRNHARNRWPAVERRASSRVPCHDTQDEAQPDKPPYKRGPRC